MKPIFRLNSLRCALSSRPAHPTVRAEPAATPMLLTRRFRLSAAGCLLLLGVLISLPASGPAVGPGAGTHPLPVMVESEIVVDLKDSCSPSQEEKLSTKYGIRLEPQGPHIESMRLRIARVAPARRSALLELLKREPLVQSAEPQYLYRPFATAPPPPNDPGFARQWHLRAIGVESAWTRTRGRGAVVAVLDTGFGVELSSGYHRLRDFDHTRVLPGYDFVDNDDIPQDDDLHGTHVAGTIAESTGNGLLGAGIAPEAAIMPLRVLGPQGGRLSSLIAALHYAADRGAHVANLSFGGSRFSALLEDALQYARSKGVLLVCAAGNDGRSGVSFPARSTACLAVSAVGPSGRVAPYSNRGPQVALAAPGGDLTLGRAAGVWQNTAVRQGLFFPRLTDTFVPLEGTSMAAPHVSGAAALLVSLGIRDPARVRGILLDTARPAGPAHQYGAGLLDVAAAVHALPGHPAVPPVDPLAPLSWARLPWWLLAVLVAALAVRCSRRWSGDAVAAISGAAFPLLVELSLPPASLLNLAGHSAAIPILWRILASRGYHSRRAAAAFSLGLLAHLAADFYRRADPTSSAEWIPVAAWFGLQILVILSCDFSPRPELIRPCRPLIPVERT